MNDQKPMDKAIDRQIEKGVDKLWEKAKIVALRVADKIPLPLHYIINAFLIIFYMGDLFIPDPIPFLDEILGAGGLYFYNVYLLRRTFGVINPMRIIRGETPATKRKIGLLPYEEKMRHIKSQMKELKKAAKEADVPGLGPDKVKKLAGEVKELEKRLRTLDRLLSQPAFQEGQVKSEMTRIEAKIEMVDDEALKEEYSKALEHAREHIGNIERIKEERNRMVARLERFSIEMDNTYSKLLASSATPGKDEDLARQFDDLLKSVDTFDDILKELETRPAHELIQEAVREVEETEQKVSTALKPRQTTKS